MAFATGMDAPPNSQALSCVPVGARWCGSSSSASQAFCCALVASVSCRTVATSTSSFR